VITGKDELSTALPVDITGEAITEVTFLVSVVVSLVRAQGHSNNSGTGLLNLNWTVRGVCREDTRRGLGDHCDTSGDSSSGADIITAGCHSDNSGGVYLLSDS
jgi:hypothetical protein